MGRIILLSSLVLLPLFSLPGSASLLRIDFSGTITGCYTGDPGDCLTQPAAFHPGMPFSMSIHVLGEPVEVVSNQSFQGAFLSWGVGDFHDVTGRVLLEITNDGPFGDQIVVNSEPSSLELGSYYEDFDISIGAVLSSVFLPESLDPDDFLGGNASFFLVLNDEVSVLRMNGSIDTLDFPADRSIPEPSAALVFGLGLLILRATLRRR